MNFWSAVLAAIGLTVSDAFRLLLVRVATEKALPFEPLVPNAETIAAMEAARRGELVTVGGVDELIADLDADVWAGCKVQEGLQTGIEGQASRDLAKCSRS